jgi:hypothetical protein
MVLKAVPIYASDQGDVLWLAPKAGRSQSQCPRSSMQAKLPLTGQVCRSSIAGQTGLLQAWQVLARNNPVRATALIWQCSTFHRSGLLQGWILRGF